MHWKRIFLCMSKRYQFQVKAQFKDRSSGSMSDKFEFLIPRRSFTDVYRNSDEVDFLRDRNSANTEGFVSELASQSKSSASNSIKYCQTQSLWRWNASPLIDLPAEENFLGRFFGDGSIFSFHIFVTMLRKDNNKVLLEGWWVQGRFLGWL